LAVETGAEYAGRVWDRWVRIRCKDGRELSVFDFDLANVHISVGDRRCLVIEATIIKNLHHCDEVERKSRTTEWDGYVVDSHWRLAGLSTQSVAPRLAQSEYVLIRSSVGGILLSQGEFSELPREGAYLCWDTLQLDLKAIL
jgi:hypothetical protein